MKLGDMEMDSDEGISFNSSNAPSQHSEHSAASNEASSSTPLSPGWIRSTMLERVPPFVFYLTGSLAILGALGGIWLIFAFALPPLLSIGVLPMLAAAFGSIWIGWVVSDDQESANEDASQRLQRRVLNLLESQPEPLRVEEIAENLGLTEERAVSTLAPLVDENHIQEDLDIDSGEWVYAKESSDPDELEDLRRKSLPISERKEALKSKDS